MPSEAPLAAEEPSELQALHAELAAAENELQWALDAPERKKAALEPDAREQIVELEKKIASLRPLGAQVKSAQDRGDALRAKVRATEEQAKKLEKLAAALRAEAATNNMALRAAETELQKLQAEALRAAAPEEAPEPMALARQLLAEGKLAGLVAAVQQLQFEALRADTGLVGPGPAPGTPVPAEARVAMAAAAAAGSSAVGPSRAPAEATMRRMDGELDQGPATKLARGTEPPAQPLGADIFSPAAEPAAVPAAATPTALVLRCASLAKKVCFVIRQKYD